MSSHHLNPRALLNAATRSLIDRVVRAGRPPMASMTALQARAFYDIGGPMLDLQPPPHVDRVEDLQIPTRDGHAMPARL
ncbi:MAG: Carboxylesterase NlhH, partial [Pseudomonadota bacterium]